jgi:hypothetical protein
MTNKEIAEKLRHVADYNLSYAHLRDLANELDPPRPEPGTVVWYKFTREPEWSLKERWRLGIVTVEGDALWTVTHDLVLLCDVEYKPARILADDEVAVKVPPVSEWPQGANAIVWEYNFPHRPSDRSGMVITRAEAEAREAGR